jgi:methanogenic corrinoid protein MtbC1
LGTNIPQENIFKMAKEKKPDLLLTYLTPNQEFKMHNILQEIDHHLLRTKFVVTGSGESLSNKVDRDNVKFVHYSKLQSTLSSIL